MQKELSHRPRVPAFALIALLAIAAGSTGAHATAFERDLSTGSTFVTVVGQSNGEGGGQPGLTPETDSGTPSQVLVFTKGNKLFTGFDPYNSTQPKFGGTAYPAVWAAGAYAGVGPMIFALDRLASYLPGAQKLVLNVCTRGSTALYEMGPGSALWDVCQARHDILAPFGGFGALVLVGLEKDAQLAANAALVHTRVMNYVAQYRALRGDVPVVIVRPSRIDFAGYPAANQATVQSQLDDVEAELLNGIVLEAQGLETIEGLHRTVDANRQVGQAIALAIWMLWNNTPLTLKIPPN